MSQSRRTNHDGNARGFGRWKSEIEFEKACKAFTAGFSPQRRFVFRVRFGNNLMGRKLTFIVLGEPPD